MSSDNPGLRIGNQERDEAARLLEEQASQGRLEPDELSDRLSAVRAARTRDDLGTAFVDLPVDPPSGEAADFPLYPGTDAATGAASTPVGQGMAVPSSGTTPAPPPPPGQGARSEVSPTTKRIGTVVMALLWPLAIVINFVAGWHLWWLFLIPIFGAGWIAYAFGLGQHPGEERVERHERRQERRRDRHGE